MYERSAIVLEKYMNKVFEFDSSYNLKTNCINYKEILEEIENYQVLVENESKIIQEFDDTVKEIEEIQKKQDKLYEENQKLEKSRNVLFTDLGEDANILENKIKKIESSLEKNNETLKNLREDFVKYLTDFSKRQKERNKCEKAKRIAETNHISYINKMKEEFKSINVKDVAKLKEFLNSEKDLIKKELNDIMTKNGKNEKIPFNQDVLKMSIKARINIAEKEAENYIFIYDKMKKLLSEIENDNLRMNKYTKALRDSNVKLAFLEAEKEYIVGFLDYERMTAITGLRVHKKKMEEACQNFELDMIQIHNLYELLLKEISNKSTKKAYKELYNKTYLKNIEDKEKNFEKEVNNIKINMGTVINSNYWRIEGIKNVYMVFNEQVTENFGKDLSEYRLEGINDTDEMEEDDVQNEVINKNPEFMEEYEDEDYEDEEYEDEEYEDEEYEDEEYEDYEDEDYEDEDYEDEEYDDEFDEELEKQKNEKVEEIDDDDWEKEIMQQLNRKRSSKNSSKKQNANIFGKLFKDKKDKGSNKRRK